MYKIDLFFIESNINLNCFFNESNAYLNLCTSSSWLYINLQSYMFVPSHISVTCELLLRKLFLIISNNESYSVDYNKIVDDSTVNTSGMNRLLRHLNAIVIFMSHPWEGINWKTLFLILFSHSLFYSIHFICVHLIWQCFCYWKQQK